MLRFISILWIAGLLFLLSCDSRPGGIPSSGKMEKLLYDYHKAQASLEVASFESSTENEKYILSVLDKYGMDSEMFDSAMVWYNAHPDKLRAIYRNIETRLKAEDDELQAKVGTSEMTAIYDAGGDTTNLWTGASLIALRPNKLQNIEKFTLKADTSYHKKDRFILNADIKFIKEDHNSIGYVILSLSIHTKEGKVFSQTSQTSTNNIERIEVSQGSDSEISEVNGFFYYKSENKTKSLCVINGISLIRMHMPEEPIDTTTIDSLAIDSLEDNKPRMRDEYPDIPTVDISDSVPSSSSRGNKDRKNEVEDINIRRAPKDMRPQVPQQRRQSVQQSRGQNGQNQRNGYMPRR